MAFLAQGECTPCSDHSQPEETAELQVLDYLQAFDCVVLFKVSTLVYSDALYSSTSERLA